MDFRPHTTNDIEAMLETIGVDQLDDLFEPIPSEIRLDRALDVPEALDEVSLMAHMRDLAARSAGASELLCFAGGGSYDHHVPAAVRSLAARAEFATSYTPYQPELSQGVLQALLEFQTLVCSIYGMEVANASLYDGANALVEAVNLTVRVTKKERVLVSGAINPDYLKVLQTYTSGLGLDIEVIPFAADGTTDLSQVDVNGAAAVVVAYPNVFGRLEDVRAISQRAHDADAMAIAIADPTAMGVLVAPGEVGCDVVVGEGHALGNPMSYGGPYVGLFATNLKFVRQVPGRIAGETLDADGKRAFVLTLQAREQHIRRARATSNVCTNQTLMAIAAAIHLSWLGPEGLTRLGEICIRRTAYAAARFSEIEGCEIRFDGPRFKEIVLATPLPGEELAKRLARRGFLVGPSLARWFPDLDDCVIVAITERRSRGEIDGLVEAIEKELAEV